MTDNERQESISALRQLLAMCDFVDQYGDSIDSDPYFNAVETAIESLNETRWIPCSERLPEKGKQVLCCNKNGSVFTSTFTYLNSNGMVAFGQHYEVIAWMPLPEPYKGGEDE